MPSELRLALDFTNLMLATALEQLEVARANLATAEADAARLRAALRPFATLPVAQEDAPASVKLNLMAQDIRHARSAWKQSRARIFTTARAVTAEDAPQPA